MWDPRYNLEFKSSCRTRRLNLELKCVCTGPEVYLGPEGYVGPAVNLRPEVYVGAEVYLGPEAYLGPVGTARGGEGRRRGGHGGGLPEFHGHERSGRLL